MSTTTDERELATVELLGAFTYAQLRAFDVTARAVRVAPDARSADAVAELAAREHQGYVRLRDHLAELTDLIGPVMDRQKPRIDGYFDSAPTGDDWRSACVFFAVALPIAGDFVREIAPALDEPTKQVVLEALTGRDVFARFATDEVATRVKEGEETREGVRRLVADLTGRALTQFQGAIADTDALEVLLRRADGEENDALIRQIAITVLEGHRRRMAQMDIDEPE